MCRTERRLVGTVGGHPAKHLAALHRRVKRRRTSATSCCSSHGRTWPWPEDTAVTGQAGRPRYRRSQLSAGPPADVRHRQLIARRRGAMGIQVGSMGFKSASQADFVNDHDGDRMLRLIQVHIPAGQPTEGARQEPQAHYRSISALEHIEQYGGMGSIPPRTHRDHDLTCGNSHRQHVVAFPIRGSMQIRSVGVQVGPDHGSVTDRSGFEATSSLCSGPVRGSLAASVLGP